MANKIINVPPKYFNDINRITSRQSQVLTVYYKLNTLHITIDNGATVAVLSKEEATRLNIAIKKTSMTAVQADGLSGLSVVGECCETLERGPVKMTFEAIVVEGLSVPALGGMNFIYHEAYKMEDI